MAFDITRVLGAQVSKLDTKAVVQIPCESIRTNPKNFYYVGVDSDLKESIHMHGVLEPLLVVADGEFYRLISGHRRLQAVRSLMVEYWDMVNTVPCLVLPGGYTDFEETAILIEANRQRVKTAYEISEEAARLTEAYTKAKEAGVELPGRIRNRVADALEVSKTKLARLNVIRTGLIVEGLKRDFADNDMPESAAYLIASKVDHEGQFRLLDFYIASHEPWSEKLVKQFLKERSKKEIAPSEERQAQSLCPVERASVEESSAPVWHPADGDDFPPVGTEILVTFRRQSGSRVYAFDTVDEDWGTAANVFDGWCEIPAFDLEVD